MSRIDMDGMSWFMRIAITLAHDFPHLWYSPLVPNMGIAQLKLTNKPEPMNDDLYGHFDDEDGAQGYPPPYLT